MSVDSTLRAHSCPLERRARRSAWARLNHGAVADYDVPFEVWCGRSRWIAGWLHLPLEEVITDCSSWCGIFSETRFSWIKQSNFAKIILKTASFAVLADPSPYEILCGDVGLAGRCYSTCSIASPSLGQCTGIQDRLGTAPGAGHLATPQRTAFQRYICFQNHSINQKIVTVFMATS